MQVINQRIEGFGGFYNIDLVLEEFHCLGEEIFSG